MATKRPSARQLEESQGAAVETNSSNQRYGLRAMVAWTERRDLTRGQAFVVGIWLAQAGAIAWAKLPGFVWRRGLVKAREWYDD